MTTQTLLVLGGRRIISAWPEDRWNTAARRGAETRGRTSSANNPPTTDKKAPDSGAFFRGATKQINEAAHAEIPPS